ncbi:magnesium transporter [Salinicoccus siamensis]|uniref:Magnesium transporter MgtE n=2 Tax=Salinicoccus siamensis TaxID=381830 RepID=A0ABV5Z519_9STAP
MRDLKIHLDKEVIQNYIDLLIDDPQMFLDEFKLLHSNEQYQIIEEMEAQHQKALFGLLPPEDFAKLFKWFSYTGQSRLFSRMSDEYGRVMLEHLPSDDVQRFFSKMDEARRNRLLEGLSEQKRSHIEELLAYEKHSAGSIMQKEFMTATQEESAKEVVERLRHVPRNEGLHSIYIVEDEKLKGLVSLRELAMAEDHQTMETLSEKVIITVNADEDQEAVAHIMQDYDVVTIPVIDSANRLLGIITVDDIIDIIEFEATEDMSELAASRGTVDLEVSPYQTAKKRAPWIVLLMFLGLLTANVIGAFEETLEAVVLLSLFIPLIMDAAGNTGTQSLAVMVRLISTGGYRDHGLFRILRRELATGVLVGLASGVTIVLLITVLYQEVWLAFVVGMSLLITLSISTIIGTILPVIISKLKIDPAVASGPFITTLNDVIGLTIYFSIATTLLQI